MYVYSSFLRNYTPGFCLFVVPSMAPRPPHFCPPQCALAPVSIRLQRIRYVIAERKNTHTEALLSANHLPQADHKPPLPVARPSTEILHNSKFSTNGPSVRELPELRYWLLYEHTGEFLRGLVGALGTCRHGDIARGDTDEDSSWGWDNLAL